MDEQTNRPQGVLRNLPAALIHETGMKGIGVSIRREGDATGSGIRKCTVGDWLLRPENQSGGWLIDGGWGGPPGPVYVLWDPHTKSWINLGYGGHLKARLETPDEPPRILDEKITGVAMMLPGVAEALDDTFKEFAGERLAFCLVVSVGETVQYVSNGDRKEMIEVLGELLERWKLGKADIPAHYNPELMGKMSD